MSHMPTCYFCGEAFGGEDVRGGERIQYGGVLATRRRPSENGPGESGLDTMYICKRCNGGPEDALEGTTPEEQPLGLMERLRRWWNS